MPDETPKPKKVFISYSWTTPDYEMRVLSWAGRTCELFTRATSKRFFENLKTLFGVASKEDFTAKIEEAFKIHQVSQWSQLTFYSDVDWNLLLNLEHLASTA
jgi:hypothetical protein